jgi:hypothetical protein
MPPTRRELSALRARSRPVDAAAALLSGTALLADEQHR